jgi:hypothetical protein
MRSPLRWIPTTDRAGDREDDEHQCRSVGDRAVRADRLQHRLHTEETERHDPAEHGEHRLRDARAAAGQELREADGEEAADPEEWRRNAERIREGRPLDEPASAVRIAEHRRGPHVVHEQQ